MSAAGTPCAEARLSLDRWQHSVSASRLGWSDQRPVCSRTDTSKSPPSHLYRTASPQDSASLLHREPAEPFLYKTALLNPSTIHLNDTVTWACRQTHNRHMTTVPAHPNAGPAVDNASMDEYWIDRDKLARIERLELEQSGLVPSGAFSHAPSRSPAYSDDEYGGTTPSGHDDPYDSDNGMRSHLRGHSPFSQANSNATFDHNPHRSPRSRSHDSTVERASSHGSNSKLPRPATSRIPVPSHSQSSASAPLDETTRAGVLSSRTHPSIPAGKKSSSNINSSASTALNSSSHNRAANPKSSAQSKKNGKTTPTTRPRVNSNASHPKRPGTASGSNRAVSATKRTRAPEGDPPWLDAFRPDPRLPPDEQLVPTVAKRQMQEKWKQEGILATAYDANCDPLNDDDPFSRVTRRPHGGADGDDDGKHIDHTAPRSPTLNPDALTSPSGRTDHHGGYRTIPNLKKPGDTPSSPTTWGMNGGGGSGGAIGSISTVPSDNPARPMSSEGVVRMPMAPEKEKVERKGCAACCLVM